MMSYHVMLCKIEESVMLQERILEVIALGGLDFYIGRDAAAAVNRAAAVGELHFFVRNVVLFGTLEVIVIKRDVGIVALNETSAGRVVVGGGESQSGIFGQRINRLHQPFA